MEENKNLTPENETELPPVELLTLEEENGQEITFEVVASLEYDGGRYVAVVESVEDPDLLSDDLQLVILSVGTDEQGDYYDIVEDDEELYQVYQEVEKLLAAEYDIQA